MSNGWQSSGGPANAGRATAAAVTIVRPMIPARSNVFRVCFDVVRMSWLLGKSAASDRGRGRVFRE